MGHKTPGPRDCSGQGGAPEAYRTSNVRGTVLRAAQAGFPPGTNNERPARRQRLATRALASAADRGGCPLRPRQSRAKNWVVERGAVGVRSGVLELLRQGLPGLQAVYHFGSSAAQDAEHEGSDVDLAVLPEGPLSPLTRFAPAGACARRLHREVDLVDLASASTVLAEQVIESGRLLYARNPAAVAGFEVAVLGKHCQLNEERRELLADIQQSGGSMADEVVLAKAEI